MIKSVNAKTSLTVNPLAVHRDKFETRNLSSLYDEVLIMLSSICLKDQQLLMTGFVF